MTYFTKMIISTNNISYINIVNDSDNNDNQDYKWLSFNSKTESNSICMREALFLKLLIIVTMIIIWPT